MYYSLYLPYLELKNDRKQSYILDWCGHHVPQGEQNNVNIKCFN